MAEFSEEIAKTLGSCGGGGGGEDHWRSRISVIRACKAWKRLGQGARRDIPGGVNSAGKAW